MENITEFQALQNSLDHFGFKTVALYEEIREDKRKTIKTYFLNWGAKTISPNLDYKNMNHFIHGMGVSKKNELEEQNEPFIIVK